jgi:hypothetical protein
LAGASFCAGNSFRHEWGNSAQADEEMRGIKKHHAVRGSAKRYGATVVWEEGTVKRPACAPVWRRVSVSKRRAVSEDTREQAAQEAAGVIRLFGPDDERGRGPMSGYLLCDCLRYVAGIDRPVISRLVARSAADMWRKPGAERESVAVLAARVT